MPNTASVNHIGQLMAVRMHGFGVFSNLEGVFELDIDVANDRIYRRHDAQIIFDHTASMWVLKNGEGAVVGRHGAKRYTPEGDWEEGKRVVAVSICT
jgi:hypothetical protein